MTAQSGGMRRPPHQRESDAQQGSCVQRWAHALSVASRLIPILLICSLSGCIAVHWRSQAGVVQHGGILRYSIVDTESARVFLTESIGLDLRLVSHDLGLSLGYRKYITVHSKPAGFPVQVQDGYCWIKESTADETGLYLRKILGADLGFTVMANGLTIGYSRASMIVGPTATESVITHIDFAEDDLHATQYTSHHGGPP